MLRPWLALACWLLAATASASDRDGVWTGKVGRAAVTACFDAGSATYYYQKHAVDLALVQREPGVWEERARDARPTGLWRLSTPHGDRLAGTWESADGKRTLPIRLELAAHLDERGCPAPAYQAPRIAVVVRAPAAAITRGGLATRSFRAVDGDVTGLEVVGDSPELVRIKRAVETLDQDLLGRYFDCMTLATTAGMRREFSGALTLMAVTPHFVLIRQSVGYFCGGAHPDGENTYFVFDRQSATLVDTDTWFTGSADALGRQHWRSEEEACADAVDGGTTFLRWPSATGMVFAPRLPHVVAACASEVTVPFAVLAPHLTAAGKRAAAEFSAAK